MEIFVSLFLLQKLLLVIVNLHVDKLLRYFELLSQFFDSMLIRECIFSSCSQHLGNLCVALS